MRMPRYSNDKREEAIASEAECSRAKVRDMMHANTGSLLNEEMSSLAAGAQSLGAVVSPSVTVQLLLEARTSPAETWMTSPGAETLPTAVGAPLTETRGGLTLVWLFSEIERLSSHDCRFLWFYVLVYVYMCRVCGAILPILVSE